MIEKIQRRKGIKSTLFLMPSLVLLVTFFVGPVILAVFYSMTNKALTGSAALATEFVGFANFLEFFKDPKFSVAFSNTMWFLIFSGLIGQMVLGFLIAYMMQKKNKNFRRIVGFVVLTAWVTPEVVTAFMFTVIFEERGVVNQLLSQFGVSPIAWLFTFPLVSVIVANAWRGAAYPMMMFQAALDNVPAEIMESARVDGANAFQILTKITLPMIKSTAGTVFIMVTLGTLNTFGLIYALTGGGPANKSTTLSLLMYQRAFLSYQIGYGMAIALCLLAVGIIFSLAYIRLNNQSERPKKTKKRKVGEYEQA